MNRRRSPGRRDVPAARGDWLYSCPIRGRSAVSVPQGVDAELSRSLRREGRHDDRAKARGGQTAGDESQRMKRTDSRPPVRRNVAIGSYANGTGLHPPLSAAGRWSARLRAAAPARDTPQCARNGRTAVLYLSQVQLPSVRRRSCLKSAAALPSRCCREGRPRVAMPFREQTTPSPSSPSRIERSGRPTLRSRLAERPGPYLAPAKTSRPA